MRALIFNQKETINIKKTKLCVVLVISMMLLFCAIAYAYDVEMAEVFAGGKADTTGKRLEFTYTATDQINWYPAVTANNGIYCAAVVRCGYINNILTKYDTCEIIGMPASGICCFAGVQNISGIGYQNFLNGKSSTLWFRCEFHNLLWASKVICFLL